MRRYNLTNSTLFANQIHYSKNQNDIKGDILYMFPGQGTAINKIFHHLFKNDEIFKENLQKADLFCKKSMIQTISTYLQGTILHKKDIPLLRNISLLIAEVSLFQKSKAILPPTLLLGHSFGEYSVLVCSGLLKLEEGLEIVYLREMSCPESSPGGMIVVNLKGKNINEVLELPEVYLANTNSTEQIALSYSHSIFENLKSLLLKKRLPFLNLAHIKYPYHSPLMQDATLKLEKHYTVNPISLENRKITIPFYSNVTNKKYESTEEISTDIYTILTKQLTLQVNFYKLISNIDMYSFYNCGPGNSLDTFVQSIYPIKTDRTIHFHKLEFRVKKEQHHNVLNSKWVSIINNVIADVTGYKLADFQITSHLQDDLGIDSIKKAEILYKVLSHDSDIDFEDISISTFTTIEEFVEYLQEASLTKSPKQSKFKSTFELFSIKKEKIHELNMHKIKKLIPFDKCKENKDCHIIDISEYSHSFSFEHVKKILLETDYKDGIRLDFVSTNITNNIFAFVSLLKSFFKDFSINIHFHYMDEYQEGLHFGNNIETFYIDKKVYRTIFTPLNSQINDNKTSKIIYKNVLFIAGHKGIGKEIIEHSQLLKDSKSITIIGRSLTKKDIGRFHYRKCDITKEKELLNIFSELGSFDLCINSAGIEISKSLADTTQEDFDLVLSVKKNSLEFLIDLLEKESCTDYIHFSSMTSYFGNPGQYAYTYANEYMRHRLAERKIRSCVLNWCGWDNVGMTENVGILQKLKQIGISLIDGQKASELFDHSLALLNKKNHDFFIMDEKDIFLMNFDLKKKSFQEIVLNSPKSLVFSQIESYEKSPDLISHKINETEIYPASFLIGNTIRLCQQVLEHRKNFSLNCSILQMIFFPNEKLHLNYHFIKNNSIDEMMVKVNGINCYHIKIKPISEDCSINHGVISKEVLTSTLYGPKVVDFGEGFKIIKYLTYYSDSKSTSATLNTTSLEMAIEGMFQSLSASGLINGKGIALPHSIESINWKRNILDYNDIIIETSIELLTESHLIGHALAKCKKTEKVLISCQNLKMTFINNYNECPLEFY